MPDNLEDCMSKTPTAQQVGEAVLLLASLFGGTAVAATPPAGAKTPEATPPSSGASGTTAAESTAVEGNSQGLSVEAFTKAGIDLTKTANGGAKAGGPLAKAVLTEFKVERFGEIAPKDYDAVLAKIEEKIEAHNLS